MRTGDGRPRFRDDELEYVLRDQRRRKESTKDKTESEMRDTLNEFKWKV